MLEGRDPRDAVLFTQRICGICSSAHAVAANLALQQTYQVDATPNGQHLINLILAADMIQNHLRHFYLLALLDYVQGADMPPFVPRQKGDYRLPQKLNDEIFSHYKLAIKHSMHAHAMVALFGAKAPHVQTIMPTGVTEQVSADRIASYYGILREIKEFVEKVCVSDVLTIGEYYKDYYNIGRGYANLLSFGAFPEPITKRRQMSSCTIVNGSSVQPLDIRDMTQETTYSWYQSGKEVLKPEESETNPDLQKEGAYSWVKAPRYQGLPFECGPLARAWVHGGYRRGVSVIDRLLARVQEMVLLCDLAEGWLGQLVPGAPSLQPYTPADKGAGFGLTDCMRGSLGHWISIEDYKIKHYEIITPTAINFSPRDGKGQRGSVEEALIGTPVADPDSPIEVGRVVRSFDPCFNCAIHLLDNPQAEPLLI
jgi:hydrogenase large subunit